MFFVFIISVGVGTAMVCLGTDLKTVGLMLTSDDVDIDALESKYLINGIIVYHHTYLSS